MSIFQKLKARIARLDPWYKWHQLEPYLAILANPQGKRDVANGYTPQRKLNAEQTQYFAANNLDPYIFYDPKFAVDGVNNICKKEAIKVISVYNLHFQVNSAIVERIAYNQDDQLRLKEYTEQMQKTELLHQALKKFVDAKNNKESAFKWAAFALPCLVLICIFQTSLFITTTAASVLLMLAPALPLLIFCVAVAGLTMQACYKAWQQERASEASLVNTMRSFEPAACNAGKFDFIDFVTICQWNVCQDILVGATQLINKLYAPNRYVVPASGRFVGAAIAATMPKKNRPSANRATVVKFAADDKLVQETTKYFDNFNLGTTQYVTAAIVAQRDTGKHSRPQKCEQKVNANSVPF